MSDYLPIKSSVEGLDARKNIQALTQLKIWFKRTDTFDYLT
jgi:hypothetical protein